MENDLISRQAAIDALGKRPMVWTDNDQYALGERNQYDIDRLAIETLPPAQTAPQWIPVSERLPKIDESVLVTTDWDDLSIAWRIGVYEWYIHEGSTNSTTDDITAWMQLPEPYRAERRTDGRD